MAERHDQRPKRRDDDATIVQSIAALVLVSLVLLGAVAMWSSWRANDLAIDREVRLAGNAFEHIAAIERGRVQEILDAANTRRPVLAEPATDTLLAHLAGPIGDGGSALLFNADGSAIVWSGGARRADVTTALMLRDIAPFAVSMLEPVAADEITAPQGPPHPISAWLRVAGRPMLAVARALPTDGAEASRPTTLAIALIQLTPQRLANLARVFVLPELSFVPALRGRLPALPTAHLPLIDNEGETLGALAWTSAGPGQWMLRNLVPQALTATGVVVAFAWFVVSRFRRRVAEIGHKEAAARRAAQHDALTGLPNRLLFTQRLDEAIAATRLDPSREFAVVYADLDRFKDINDTLGHQAGDEVLRQTASRFASTVGANDTAARLAGDEFALLLTDLIDRADLETRLARLVAAIAEPIPFGERTIYPGGSLGASVAPHDGTDRTELQHRADLALYRAKAAGRGRWLVYSDEMDDGHRRRQALRQDLHAALAENRLTMLYQPSFASTDMRPVSLEARVAWDHPTRGRIPAAEFIPIAEESGLIRDLGQWVLRRACRDARAFPNLSLVVNLSPSELRHPHVAADILRCLAEEGFPASGLQVDLTENALNADADIAIAVIERLREAGVRIALDEFGSGQSSFNYLSRFRFDLLKIDQAMIDRIETSNEIATILHATIDLARRLGLETAAEGIETFGQLRFVQAMQCDTVQGHLFARPMPIGDVAAFLARPQSERLRVVA